MPGKIIRILMHKDFHKSPIKKNFAKQTKPFNVRTEAYIHFIRINRNKRNSH